MRIVVLGAGFGGLELTTRLSDEFGDDVDVVLIDRTESFVFGFSKLEVMFGRATEPSVQHRYADIVKPGVQFVQTNITAIDPGREARRDRGWHVRRGRPRDRARCRPATRPRRRGSSKEATSSTQSGVRSPAATCSRDSKVDG